MNTQPMLLVAYQCAPGQGSVSQIGWEWYARLCGQPGLALVTHVRNRAALQAAGAPLDGSEIIYIDTEWFAAPLYRLARWLFPRSEHSVFALASLDYFMFDACAYWQLRRRLAAGAPWRLLHRVTPVTLAAPTCLGRLGLATVVGPLNCGLGDPPGLEAAARAESHRWSALRALPRLLDKLLDSSGRCAAILTASRATLAAVAPRHRQRCRMMCENGVDLQRFPATPWPPAPGPSQPLRILFAGRLVAVKGLDLLLDACAALHARGLALELDVVGDGPMRDTWMEQARRLGLSDAVRFHGAATLDAVAARMQACHVLCLPSLRESGGAVLLEAMASARPVIALDFGGPGEIVTPAVGALLPVGNAAQVGNDLAATLADIWRAPEAWRERGLNGRCAVEARFSWPAKIAAARELYQELCGKPAKPRLAYLVSRYPAVSHTFILREIQQLRSAGFEIAVASINLPDQSLDHMDTAEQAEAGATYYVKRHGLRGALLAHLAGWMRPWPYIRALWRALRIAGADGRRLAYAVGYFTEALMLARWLDRQGLRHLHVHFATAAASVALVLRQFHRAGISLTVHGPDEFYDAPGQRLCAKIAAADFIICISAYARSQLMHLAPAGQWSKFHICRLGVDPDAYAPGAGMRAERPFTVLCVGRLTPAKGQRLLIDACREVSAAGWQLRLVLVGTGPDEAALKAHVQAQGLHHLVTFTGALNQRQVRAHYDSADVFALASFAEGIPVVLMEAMACGVPVVAPRITGIPELIRDGEDGLLVTPSDRQALAAALLRLMEDAPLRARLADNARARVVREYHLARNVEQLGHFFRHYLGGHA